MYMSEGRRGDGSKRNINNNINREKYISGNVDYGSDNKRKLSREEYLKKLAEENKRLDESNYRHREEGLRREELNTKKGAVKDKLYDTALNKLRGELGRDISKIAEDNSTGDYFKNERLSESEILKLEKEAQRKKAERLRETLGSTRKDISKRQKAIKRNNDLSKEQKVKEKGKVKAFMESGEVKMALDYIWKFGGVYGKAFVIIVKFLNYFGLLGFVLTGLLLIVVSSIAIALVMFGAIIVLVMGGEDIPKEKGVEVGEEVTSSNVNVPKGYEGKIMYPMTKTLNSSRGMSAWHKGLDLYGQPENVYPIYPGIVIMSAKGHAQASNNGNGATTRGSNDASKGLYFTGDGNAVQVAHDLGNGKYIISYYMHLAPNSIKVKVGDKVGYGTVLGTMGNSGNSTGTHLHLEIYDKVDKEFFTKGQSHYKSKGNWYSILTSKIIAPSPLMTCGGKSGVVANQAGAHTFPKSCVNDAKEARSK